MITKGDVEEDEDLCAVPPHIMRIMQVVQNMSTMSVLMLMMITAVTLVIGKVMMTEQFLKSYVFF